MCAHLDDDTWSWSVIVTAVTFTLFYSPTFEESAFASSQSLTVTVISEEECDVDVDRNYHLFARDNLIRSSYQAEVVGQRNFSDSLFFFDRGSSAPCSAVRNRNTSNMPFIVLVSVSSGVNRIVFLQRFSRESIPRRDSVEKSPGNASALPESIGASYRSVRSQYILVKIYQRRYTVARVSVELYGGAVVACLSARRSVI